MTPDARPEEQKRYYTLLGWLTAEEMRADIKCLRQDLNRRMQHMEPPDNS